MCKLCLVNWLPLQMRGGRFDYPASRCRTDSGSSITSLLCVLGLFGDFEDPSQSPCPIFPHWCSTLNNPKINIKKIEENWSSSSRTTCGGPALVYWQLRAIVLDLFFGCCGVTENKIVLIILGIVHGKLNQRICIGTRSWTVNSITINIEIKQETQPWSWR